MTRALSLIIVIVALHGVALSQTSGFNREQLSATGKVAYDRLASACIFRIGSVGYSGSTPQEELALYDLLKEAKASEALKSLVATGSYEGGLYGLLGLSLTSNADFNRAVDIYKARTDHPRVPQTMHCQIGGTPELVATQWGCIITTELRTKVVIAIQSGHYDRWVSAEYRPRQ